MTKDLDAQVEAFRTRPLDAGPYTFLAADALTMKVREDGRVVKIAVMVATGVNADGYREILGVQTSSGETGAGWLTIRAADAARSSCGSRAAASTCFPVRRGSPRRSWPLGRMAEVFAG